MLFYIKLIVNEIAPIHLTGALGSVHQLLITFSTVIAYLFGLRESGDFYWRIAFGLPLILCCLQALSFLIIYRMEPPPFLISLGKDEDVFLPICSYILG